MMDLNVFYPVFNEDHESSDEDIYSDIKIEVNNTGK